MSANPPPCLCAEPTQAGDREPALNEPTQTILRGAEQTHRRPPGSAPNKAKVGSRIAWPRSKQSHRRGLVPFRGVWIARTRDRGVQIRRANPTSDLSFQRPPRFPSPPRFDRPNPTAVRATHRPPKRSQFQEGVRSDAPSKANRLVPRAIAPNEATVHPGSDRRRFAREARDRAGEDQILDQETGRAAPGRDGVGSRLVAEPPKLESGIRGCGSAELDFALPIIPNHACHPLAALTRGR